MTATFGMIALNVGLWIALAHNLPSDLREIASDLGCAEVADFYERPGMVEPPYIYGYFSGSKEDSAIFWCQDTSGAGFRLVSVRGSLISTFSWRNYPGGLSVSDVVDWRLDDFRYIDDRTKAGPAQKSEFAPLRAEYDGVITLFYPLGDRWLYRILH